MQNSNYEYEEEINLKDLFFYCLAHWRGILAGLLIGALLGGGFAVVKDLIKPEVAKVVEVSPDAKEDLMAAQEQLQYVQQLYDYSEARMDDLQSYVEESRLMELNPYELYQGSVVYAMEAPQKNAERVKALVNSFVTGGGLYWHLLNENVSYSAQELAQLISVSISVSTMGSVLQDADKQQSELVATIHVLGESQEEAESQAAVIRGVLNDYVNEISREFGVKEQGLLHTTVTQASSFMLADYQDIIRSKINAEKNNINGYKKDVIVAEDAVKSAEAAIGSLEVAAPETDGISIKNLVLYAVIGGFLGGAAVGGYLLLVFFFGGKLYAVSDPERKFGVTVLGSIHDVSGLKGFDSWIAQKRHGIYSALPVEEQRENVLLNVKNQLKKYEGMKSVLLVSSLGEQSQDATILKNGLDQDGYEVTACQNVIGRADILSKVTDEQVAVVVESYESSKIVLVREEMDVLRKYVDRVVGLVVTQ